MKPIRIDRVFGSMGHIGSVRICYPPAPRPPWKQFRHCQWPPDTCPRVWRVSGYGVSMCGETVREACARWRYHLSLSRPFRLWWHELFNGPVSPMTPPPKPPARRN
jgi:hypothetical protein